MKYLLDTNTCIRAINGRAPRVRERLLVMDLTEIMVCSVVKGEMFAGAARSQMPTQSFERQQLFLQQFVSLPFDDAEAMVYGQVRGMLEQAGTPIGPLDTMIAAIALANNLILVTHNTREFARVVGLTLEDWE